MVTVQERLGTDIMLNLIDSNDLEISSKSDFKTVFGYENLKQAIIVRLLTGIGEQTLHPAYGCRLSTLIGTNATEFTIPLARQYIREALLQEPRISTIDDITVTFTDDLMTIMRCEIIATPIDSFEPLNIVFPFFLIGEA